MLRYLANTRLAVEEWKMTYFPLVQPGVLRKVVKSVLLFWQQDQPREIMTTFRHEQTKKNDNLF